MVASKYSFPDAQPDRCKQILVTGATGYVGSRLIPLLLEKGFSVKAAGRSLSKLKSRTWAADPKIELVQLDMNDLDSVRNALVGCSHVYYLVHSMNPQTENFEHADRTAASNMVTAGDEAKLKQLIYLGGLGEIQSTLSKHLRSRAEVGEILSSGDFPVTVLRAAMVIGSGSASFEILRYLVERLPVMVAPRWVVTPSQPIAIRNVLVYLINCLNKKETYDKTFDIGGPDVLSYRELMDTYAEEAGLPPRKIIGVPVFTPRLSSYWINFITPVPAFIARPLAEGLRNPAVCTNSDIKKIIPQTLISCREAIKIAIDKTQHHLVESHWTDAGKLPPAEWCNPSDPQWAGGTVYVDERRIEIAGKPPDAWKAVSKIGGTYGWYYANFLWHIRGWMDNLIGGVGLRRGRRHPEILRPGDALDFWRVSDVETNSRLLLLAEMKLPGQAALEFRITEPREGVTAITQSARFLPRGLMGIVYWNAVSPLHELIFSGMLRGIAKASGASVIQGPYKIKHTRDTAHPANSQHAAIATAISASTRGPRG